MLKTIDKRVSVFGGSIAAILFSFIFTLFIPYNVYVLTGLMLIIIGAFAGIGNLKPLFFLLFFLLPFSIEVPIGLGDSKILFPSEAILVVLFVAFIVKAIFLQPVKKEFLYHPVSVAIIIYFMVMIVTTLTSQMQVVSFKYTLINILYVTVFYFAIHYLIRKDHSQGLTLYYINGSAVFIVIIYALYNHISWNFRKDVANIVVRPFFSDHAIYSACLAMLFPVFLISFFKRKAIAKSELFQLITGIILLALLFGLIFSYSRAAWISLAASALMLIALLIKLKPVLIFSALMLTGIIFYIQKDELISHWKLNRNNSTISNPTIEEQTKSITNITSDVSNAERLNRWSCAYRMFLDKPLTGFGPGTYQFQYLTYQRPSEMTRISVTSAYHNPLGKGGSAHSEYLLALSESGIGGFLGLLSIILLSVYYGLRSFYNCESVSDKVIVAAALLSIITYATHVLFNNYLNIDKTAGLFWTGIAIIVSIDSGAIAGSNKRLI
jgi:putative inorganic carbon (hco3(-)) transporter